MRQGLLFSIIVTIVLCAPVFGYDWSTNPGDGSAANPYQISTPEQLMSIGANTALLDKHFKLTNDIVFDPDNNPAHVFSQALIAPYTDSSSPVFSGYFNGNGHQIVNLKINADNSNVGLFGVIKGSGPSQIKVENMILVNPTISGPTVSGSLVGSVKYCKIINCHVQGGIVSRLDGSYMGGLIGTGNQSIISSCTSSANISGVDGVGGLAAMTFHSSFVTCSASGNVAGSGTGVGGLLGRAAGSIEPQLLDRVEIIDCFASGNVYSEAGTGGGLIGWARTGQVQNCYASGTVTGGDRLGGLIGYVSRDFYYPYFTPVTVSGCYAMGNVEGQGNYTGGLIGYYSNASIVKDCYAQGDVSTVSGEYVGGLIGYCDSQIARCFSKGKVTGTSYRGGLIGSGSGGVVNSFWDTQTSTLLTSAGGTGKTTAEMKIISTFIDPPTNWDFVGESASGENEIWRMCVDDIDYPRLSWEFAKNGDFACGDGTDILDLQTLAEHWLLTETANPPEFNYACDANGDGAINLVDYSVLGENW